MAEDSLRLKKEEQETSYYPQQFAAIWYGYQETTSYDKWKEKYLILCLSG